LKSGSYKVGTGSRVRESLGPNLGAEDYSRMAAYNHRRFSPLPVLHRAGPSGRGPISLRFAAREKSVEAGEAASSRTWHDHASRCAPQ